MKRQDHQRSPTVSLISYGYLFDVYFKFINFKNKSAILMTYNEDLITNLSEFLVKKLLILQINSISTWLKRIVIVFERISLFVFDKSW